MFYANIFKQPQYRLVFIFSRLLSSVSIQTVLRFCFFKSPQWKKKLINRFSYVIPTIIFQRLKILLVFLLLFIVKYVFRTVCKTIDGKTYFVAYLLHTGEQTFRNCCYRPQKINSLDKNHAYDLQCWPWMPRSFISLQTDTTR